MAREVDLLIRPGKKYNGHKTREIYSNKKGYLATLVYDLGLGLSLMTINVLNHVREPQSPDTYNMVAQDDPIPRWALTHNGRDLGYVTTGEGANNLLNYMKENVTNEN